MDLKNKHDVYSLVKETVFEGILYIGVIFFPSTGFDFILVAVFGGLLISSPPFLVMFVKPCVS